MIRSKRYRPLNVETLDSRSLPSSMFVGDAILLPNRPNQEILIMASGETQVRGVNLRIQMGDGRGPIVEPTISAVSFADAIWAEHVRHTEGGPIEDEPNFAQVTTAILERDTSVKADGIVARLVVDTTGIFGGTFDVRLKDNLFGVASDFAGIIPSPLNNGSISVAGPGDANLDGRFDANDLISVFQAGEYQDATEDNSTWAEGDWNNNGDFETSDLILAFQVGVYIRN